MDLNRLILYPLLSTSYIHLQLLAASRLIASADYQSLPLRVEEDLLPFLSLSSYQLLLN
jgi:hypothetical protein